MVSFLKKGKSITEDQKGFTLFEILFVLIISGLILVTFSQALKAYLKNAQYETTVENIRRLQSALEEFVALQGRFPCPADPSLNLNDVDYGIERCRDPVAGAVPNGCTVNMPVLKTDGVTPTQIRCVDTGARDADGDTVADTVLIGMFPIRTVLLNQPDSGAAPLNGIDAKDGYGSRFTYAISEKMTDLLNYSITSPVNINLGAIRVEDENENTVVDPIDSVNYVIFSHGENKDGAYNNSGVIVDNCFVTVIPGPPGPMTPGPRSGMGSGLPPDKENCDGNDAIFTKSFLSIGTDADYYDDILVFNSGGLQPLWVRSIFSLPGESFMRNTNVDNVGVGEDPTTPADKLSIQGDIAAEVSIVTSQICDSTGTNCFNPNLIGGDQSVMNCANPGDVAYAIGQDNTGTVRVLCRPFFTSVPNVTCPPGQFLTGISNLGNTLCN